MNIKFMRSANAIEAIIRRNILRDMALSEKAEKELEEAINVERQRTKHTFNRWTEKRDS